MQLGSATTKGPRAQLKSEKIKKLRSDCGKKRVKRVMKIAWFEGARSPPECGCGILRVTDMDRTQMPDVVEWTAGLY